mmetsp:Transcript_32174/g.43942  ORF Transcript_32174/g.43942 Transcript_32174/m.43942 type:complete len:281 (-) Transcript_32174:539-1381(-)
MSRHQNCNLFIDNFTFEHLGVNCPTCIALGETYLCGSHPQRPAAPATPRLKDFVFVLVFMPPKTFPNALGTAWVVNSSSMTLLMTALHCLNPPMGFETIREHLYVVKSIIYNDNDSITYDTPPIAVRAICGDMVSDVAVLQADFRFSEGIAMCPISQFPSARNEDKVKTYYVPCQSFPYDTPILSSSYTDYSKVLLESNHHLFLAGQHMHGSSGGVVVDVLGRAVALICSGYIPGIKLPLPDCFQTVWETVSALSEGRGTYTRCVKFNAVPALHSFLEEH